MAASLRNDVLDYVREEYGIEADYPFSDDTPVLRNLRNRKWFGIIMTVSPRVLGLDGDGAIDIMNVKCTADTLTALLGTEGFLPAYHMNKSHWITVRLDGTAPIDTALTLVDMSYDIIDGIGRKKRIIPLI